MVPHRVGKAHDGSSPQPDRDAQPTPTAHTVNSGRDASGFLEHIKEHAKPGLASFMGNAHMARIEERALILFFDPTRSNLIPMIKNAGNLQALREHVLTFFSAELEIQFAVAHDPLLVAKEADERAAMQAVNDHPTIKFLLEHFKGRILNCSIIEGPKE